MNAIRIDNEIHMVADLGAMKAEQHDKLRAKL